MKLPKELIKQLINHVGCGDLDNYGKCDECATIRQLLRQLADED